MHRDVWYWHFANKKKTRTKNEITLLICLEAGIIGITKLLFKHIDRPSLYLQFHVI